MKNLIVAIVVLVSSMVIASPSDTLIDALITVESNGNSSAIGDNGKAVGCLQIHQGVVDDVNRVSKNKYTYEDRKDVNKSREMCKEYLTYWGNHYTKKTGKVATDELYAKIWNGGAMAWKKTNVKVVANLNSYWNKVSRYM